MLKLGLIGKNISYSKSPDIHHYMQKVLNIELTYDLIDVYPKGLDMLIKQLKAGIYHGFNVTQPYKEDVMTYCDIITPKAKEIEAVNTIYLKNGLVVGDNTDYDGFLGMLDMNHIDVSHKKVFITGTGGAAKACYHVLKDLGAVPKLVTRDALKKSAHIITYDDMYQKQADLIVQATPVGTYPDIKQSIVDQSYVADKFVIDLVYRPKNTQILKDAKNGINGLEMLIIQAIKSLSLWMNKDIEINDQLISKLKEVVQDE